MYVGHRLGRRLDAVVHRVADHVNQRVAEGLDQVQALTGHHGPVNALVCEPSVVPAEPGCWPEPEPC